MTNLVKVSRGSERPRAAGLNLLGRTLGLNVSILRPRASGGVNVGTVLGVMGSTPSIPVWNKLGVDAPPPGSDGPGTHKIGLITRSQDSIFVNLTTAHPEPWTHELRSARASVLSPASCGS